MVDRNDLATEGRPNPLVEALSGADRRVQFAAAEALVKLDPRGAFSGSSRVVSILARFVAGQAEPRAIVIDGNSQRGGQTAGLLRTIGYEAEVLTTASLGFEAAAASADVELIVADPYFVNDTWGLPELLGNLKADGRTAGIPVFLVGPLALRDRMARSVESFPATRFLVTPTETRLLGDQLDRAMAALGVRPLSAEERADYAGRAAGLLALIARRPGSPFESDLAGAEPALAVALNSRCGPGRRRLGPGRRARADRPAALADVGLDTSHAAPSAWRRRQPGPPHPPVRPQARRRPGASARRRARPRSRPRPPRRPRGRRRRPQARPRRLGLALQTYRADLALIPPPPPIEGEGDGPPPLPTAPEWI